MDGPHGLAGKTAERYRQLIEAQIIPYLGAIVLQKLKPAHMPIGMTNWSEAAARTAGRYLRGR
jgi:hypothetical protein